jgi:hypothetical protein
MTGLERKNFAEPDEVEDYGEQGFSHRVTLGIADDSTVWRSNLLPGWSWLRNIKPTVPFERCPMHHREYVESGSIRYLMEDGSEVIGVAGDHLLIEPGHLAEVVGNEPCVLIDW